MLSAEDQKNQTLTLQRAAVFLKSSQLKLQILETVAAVAINTMKKMYQGIQYYIPVLQTSAYSNYFSVVKDIWCSITQFLAHKRTLSLGRIRFNIRYSPP